MIEQVYQLLSGDTDLMSAISSTLHYGRLPDGIKAPGIVLQRVSLTGQQNFRGASQYKTGIFRVNVLAVSYLSAEDIARMVRDLLDGYRGNDVAFIALDDEADIPVNVPEGQDRPNVWGIRIDFRFGQHQPVDAGT